MIILLLLSFGLNTVFIRSYVKREQRRRSREHKRYRRQFVADLKRINADWTPELPEVLTPLAESSGESGGQGDGMRSL